MWGWQVQKQQARFYLLQITQQQIDEGFLIRASSANNSKFKLLLFECTPEHTWELLAQVPPPPPPHPVHARTHTPPLADSSLATRMQACRFATHDCKYVVHLHPHLHPPALQRLPVRCSLWVLVCAGPPLPRADCLVCIPQDDSTKVHKQRVASFVHLHLDIAELGPMGSPIETGASPLGARNSLETPVPLLLKATKVSSRGAVSMPGAQKGPKIAVV